MDPNSGTIALLEMARGIGLLAQNGWRPRRTLMLCSWDGEEYGLVGSTEWAEANDAMLTRAAVAYLNVDVAVSGDNLRVNGSHALEGLIAEDYPGFPEQSVLETLKFAAEQIDKLDPDVAA